MSPIALTDSSTQTSAASPLKVPPSSAETVFGRAEGTKYKMIDQPLGQRRHLKVIYLGGGASAINFAHRVTTKLQDVELVCYEKNPELTGTWFENKYPGCACDIPSHTYQFTWNLYPDWPKYYSTSDEIQAYMNKTVDDFGLRKYFKCSHEVVGARWDANTSHWIIKVRRNNDPNDTFEDWCDFFVNGSGLLNAWKWPDIKGLHDFKGKILHTAAYDRSIVTTGKKISLIGVGSSAVQVLPALQPTAEHMYHFFRSKTWITPSFAATYAGPNGSNFEYTQEQKDAFRADPVAHRKYTRAIENELNKRFLFVIKDSDAQREIFENFTKEMKAALNNRQDLIDVLVPDFAVGCRRLTPAPGFLAALQKPNVTPVTTGISHIDETGVVSLDGKHYDSDIIICATGFDISFRPKFPVIGRDNVDLRDKWADRARGYLSMFVDGFPNYITIMGPGSPSAHGPLLASSENVCDYALKVLHRLQTEPIKTIEVKPEAVAELSEHAQEQLKTTAWSSHCSSWFKNGKKDGPLDSLHPGGRLHYFASLANPRWEDFNFEYSNNRFAHYGNGFVLRELEGGDLTWYWASGDRLSLFEY
ncbi:hypothetical protein MNV49_000759 [Pseudohyphozyma bogoriensis]|nr:hypothetical protein MNV49_000759 [Pseudohyphozyma bogoriensis]